ncbi:hypothetical protein OP862_11125 [Yersinia massiliensis]|jgi:hypothetical protein|uniref:Lipoprotein n=1 Tax=Yersinia massiliensis TaxID=419257 RepID=A0A2R4NQ15_9GAMM|nr:MULTISPECIES: hypothetical protein [Yersinia]HEI6964322.1 hypothetical protein [Yersinia enterocolitica]ATM85887.1 hypothetical protein CRN74_07240 [Yersinia frederiksenii]AVX38178.1 hypothetical protein DA391_11195 [Yersinia massiliensis]MCB5316485.1 hypothetical protein [Yersinia massiliensis]MDA5547750.1 hypothetical protein [Yersinia massiliensis]
MKRLLFVIALCSIGTASATCKVPESIEGKDFIMAISASYSPTNPMAGNVYKMQYRSDKKYNYKVLNNGNDYSGQYQYKRIADNIGIISSEEMFGEKLAKYTLTLICDNDNSGVYFYQQSDGVAGNRSNTSHYYLLN